MQEKSPMLQVNLYSDPEKVALSTKDHVAPPKEYYQKPSNRRREDPNKTQLREVLE
jgi:hypothetical protein